MKRNRTIRSAAFMFAISAAAASAVPCFAGEPAWGWKPDEVAHYKELPKPKKPEMQGAWNATAIVPATPSTSGPNPPGAKAAPASQPPATVKAYCQNIEDAALDARFLHQKSELQHLGDELAKRTAALEAKRAEYQEWLNRRNEFIAKAEGSLVELYSEIKPDAAAQQLAAIDEEAAAALLLKLSARKSSAILNQMDSGKAARLVSVMIGAAKPEEKAAAVQAAAQKNPGPETGPVQQDGKDQRAGQQQPAEQQQPTEKKL